MSRTASIAAALTAAIAVTVWIGILRNDNTGLTLDISRIEPASEAEHSFGAESSCTPTLSSQYLAHAPSKSKISPHASSRAESLTSQVSGFIVSADTIEPICEAEEHDDMNDWNDSTRKRARELSPWRAGMPAGASSGHNAGRRHVNIPNRAVSVGIMTSAYGNGHHSLNQGNNGDPNADMSNGLINSEKPGIQEEGPDYDYSDSNSPITDPEPLPADEFSHKLPVRFGLTMQYRINQRTAIETGLMYTLLRSDIHHFDGESKSKLRYRQELHYLGIPVNIKYNAFSWKRLDVYVSAGVLAEKCVAGNISSASPSSKEYSYEGSSERPFQFSVNAAAGAQLNVSSMFGIYVEPGISYFFDDGSRLRSIYKEHPFTFNLNIGLRMNLP